MHRWFNQLRSLSTLHSCYKTNSLSLSSSLTHYHRFLHTSPRNTMLFNPIVFNGNTFDPKPKQALLYPNPLSFIQLRHLTKKEMKEKMLKYKPRTPVTSKLKKYKIKPYSSFKGRFRVMHDGQIRRWKEGKRHNAHLKSKAAKRRGRRPGIVPAAYAKVMKKLNFCG